MTGGVGIKTDEAASVQRTGALFLVGIICALVPFNPARAAAASTNTTALVVDLFEEGQWQACRTECRRLLLTQPREHHVRLLKAVAELRLGVDSISSLTALYGASDTPDPVRGMARYEAAMEYWQRGDLNQAFVDLRHAFLHAPDRDLFLRAGCSLHLLLLRYEVVPSPSPDLRSQLAVCEPLWSIEMRRSCVPPLRSSGCTWTGRPGQWLIALYRKQISPAIGARCSLHPSCSEYGRQALAKHGLLGFPMIADRGFREPGVVAERARPVVINGKRRYQDPLENHDHWMDN